MWVASAPAAASSLSAAATPRPAAAACAPPRTRSSARSAAALQQRRSGSVVAAAASSISSTWRPRHAAAPGASVAAAAAAAAAHAAAGRVRRCFGGASDLPHHRHNNARRVTCRVLTESVSTDSAEMALGARAPDFELPEPLTGKTVSLASLTAAAADGGGAAKATLVMFVCNHCPFVVMLKDAIAQLAKEYQQKGVAVVAISSNSIETHPQDGPEQMAADAKKFGYTFPFLFDESQSVAKAYRAACTPEFYVFDSQLQLTYHGQFDDARPNSNKLVTGADLRTALDATLSGSGLPAGFKAKPSIGCNIKWAPGAEPDYYGTQIVKK